MTAIVLEIRWHYSMSLSTEFLAEMKKRLSDEHLRLQDELSRFAHRNPQLAEEIHGSSESADDSAADVANISDSLSLEEELVKALRDAESALKAIEKGVYGVCKYCKRAIDERRLQARPMSSSCIECKKTLTQEV